MSEHEIPELGRANSVRVGTCGHNDCNRPHIILLREDGVAFADFVWPDGDSFLRGVVDAINTMNRRRGVKAQYMLIDK